MTRWKYFIETYDPELTEVTPQIGVRRGPYTLFGLRAAITALRNLGYSCNYLSKNPDEGDPSVKIWREKR